MIVAFISTVTKGKKIRTHWVYVDHVSEINQKDGVFEFIQKKGEWVNYPLRDNVEIRIYHDFQTYDPNRLFISKPTVEKLNKALKLDEL